MNKVLIYTLTDPRTNLVRYVGMTRKTLKQRLSTHMSIIRKKENNRRSTWIRKLAKLNLKPIIELLDEVDEADWDFYEQYWISQIKTWGFDLKNTTLRGKSSFDILRVKGSVTRQRDLVYQLDRDKNIINVFKNAIDAAKTLNLTIDFVKDRIKHRFLYTKTNYIFCRKYQYDDLVIKLKPNPSTKGDANGKTIKTIYRFWKNNDDFQGTMSEFSNYTGIPRATVYTFIKNPKAKFIKDWVLYENKDQYNSLFKIHTLIHPVYGKQSGKAIDFYNKYKIDMGIPKKLKDKTAITYKDWRYCYE